MVLPRPETISKVLGRLVARGSLLAGSPGAESRGSLLAGSPGAEATDANALFETLETLEDPVLLLSDEAFMVVVSPSLVDVVVKVTDGLTE
jgi:hypothetical protein